MLPMLRYMVPALCAAALLISMVAIAEQGRAINAADLLKELGDMVKTIPNSKDDCQARLREISEWQKKKLKEIQSQEEKGNTEARAAKEKKAGETIDVSILEPKEGTTVSVMPEVKGTVSDPKTAVWLVVHPIGIPDYWFQPEAAVKKDGTWSAQPNIGRPGNIDKDKKFELRAVANPAIANPKEELREGLVLHGWPKGDGISGIVVVTRE